MRPFRVLFPRKVLRRIRLGAGGEVAALLFKPYASLRLRIFAFLYDYGITAVYLALTAVAGSAVLARPGMADRLFGSPWKGQLIGFLVVTLPVGLYFTVMESSAGGATWGKSRQGIFVAAGDGTPLGLLRSAGRTALKFLPWELSHICVWHMSFAAGDPPAWTYAALAAVWVLIGANLASVRRSPSGQALYDRIVGSTVFRGKPRDIPTPGLPTELHKAGP